LTGTETEYLLRDSRFPDSSPNMTKRKRLFNALVDFQNEHQVGDKMGEFFEEVFFPTMKKLVESDLSYDDVKKSVRIPTTWSAKISGDQFRERVARFHRMA
jgi:hypothetical protein